MAKTTSVIKKEILAVASAALKINERVHRIACDALEHYMTEGKGYGSGDTSMFAFMVNKLWKTGVHRRALIQWFEKHGGTKFVVENGQAKFLKKKGFDHTKVDLDKAQTSPFYADDELDGKTEKDKVFDIVKRMKTLVAMNCQVQAGEREGYDVSGGSYLNPQQIATLEGWIDEWEHPAEEGNQSSETEKPVFKGTHGAHQPNTTGLLRKVS